MAVGDYVIVLVASDAPLAETVYGGGDALTQLRVETGLSTRELEILRRVCAGLSDAEIARDLLISVKTVQTHVDRIRDKSGCRQRPELIAFAHDRGVV